MHIFYEESFQKQCFRYASQKIVDFHFAISNTLQRWTLFENHCGSPILKDFERSELRLFCKCDVRICTWKWPFWIQMRHFWWLFKHCDVRYVSNYSWVSKSVISTTELLLRMVNSTLTFFNAFCGDKMCSEETMNNLPQTVKKESLFTILQIFM